MSERQEELDKIMKPTRDYIDRLNKELELYKKALFESCLYTTELNSYAHKPNAIRRKRAREYAKEYLDQARKEIKNEDKKTNA